MFNSFFWEPTEGSMVHAIDPDESDGGKFQQSENSSFSRFTNSPFAILPCRTKEQLQASFSVYSRKDSSSISQISSVRLLERVKLTIEDIEKKQAHLLQDLSFNG